MKSSTSNLTKKLGTGLAFIAIAPLTPVIALMYLTAWLCDESQEDTANELPVPSEPSSRLAADLSLAA